MSEKMFAQEDGGFAFTDEDFERRYTPEAGPANPSRPGNQEAKSFAAPIGRSRNKFMRTLLRRRFRSSAPT